jgi:hypothetical protein
MLLYRLECSETGKGPMNGRRYVAMRGWDKLPNMWADWPWHEVDRDQINFYFCATPSPSLLREWTPEYDAKERGYVVKVLDVPDEHVVKGNSGMQAFYRKEHARVVDTLSPITFANME